MSRVLKAVNIFIAAVLIALGGFAFWFAWRPLPKTSGHITLPLHQKATITRDALGVPHIAAADVEDALFLHGYVHAQDRLFQMDALRRLAAGELSAVIGPGTLELDQESRRLRLRRIADEQSRTLPPGDRVMLAAYARGVNAFIETHLGNLPLEFTLLGYDPRPWTIADSLLVALQMMRTLTNSWRDEVTKRNMIASGDTKKIDFLYSSRTGREVQLGSNAWAIAGKHTASGKPILANDPHLEFGLPSTWYMAHLQAPGLNVTGVTIAGLPGVIIGHNERIAWGITNLQFDSQDLYREQLDRQTGRYQYQGKVEQARAERETVIVKGSRNIESVQWVTRHGPVVYADGNQAFALRWTGAEKGGLQFPFLDIDRAKDWREFTTAIARLPGPGSNFVYADVDGNIGYHAAGRLPLRRNHDGDLPVEGPSGDYEWDGYIPFDELPSAYNPASGYLITANQNPFPENYPYRVHGNFAPYYRSRQIQDLLTAKEGWQVEGMLAIQTDVYSASSQFLARQAVKAYEARGSRNASLADAVETLRSWNGQMQRGTAAPFLATLLFQHVRRAVAERASPGKGAGYEYGMSPAVIEKLLTGRPEGWFDDYDQMLLRAFVDAVEEGRRIQGRNIGKWDYGRYLELSLNNPVAGRLPMVGKYFNIGPVPMSGASTTVKQTTRRLGPSMRMVADLSDWDHSLNNITIGQSGQPLSSHYKDQWNAYYSGRSFPMQFREVKAKDVLTVDPGN